MTNVIKFKRTTNNKSKSSELLTAAINDEYCKSVKYEVLLALRNYHLYESKDLELVEYITEIMIENLQNGEDFPLVPETLCDNYCDVVVHGLSATRIKLNEAWKCGASGEST